jgi:hypothetical protein
MSTTYEHTAPGLNDEPWSWDGELDKDTVIHFPDGTTSTLSEIITATNGEALQWWEEQSPAG